ncbi:MAG: hypothetical protein ACHQCE_09395 [Streptosporangiales bacterium]
MTDTKRARAQRHADTGRRAGLAGVKREPGRAWPEDSTMREEL